MYGLTYLDAERFRNSLPNVEVVVPSRRLPQQAWYRNRKVSVEVIGTVPWYPEISPVRIMSGRFLGSIDMHHKQGICVIDENVVIGTGSHLGQGEDLTPNHEMPDKINTGITVVGAGTHVPGGLSIGRNVLIQCNRLESDFPGTEIPSGETV